MICNDPSTHHFLFIATNRPRTFGAASLEAMPAMRNGLCSGSRLDELMPVTGHPYAKRAGNGRTAAEARVARHDTGRQEIRGGGSGACGRISEIPAGEVLARELSDRVAAERPLSRERSILTKDGGKRQLSQGRSISPVILVNPSKRGYKTPLACRQMEDALCGGVIGGINTPKIACQRSPDRSTISSQIRGAITPLRRRFAAVPHVPGLLKRTGLNTQAYGGKTCQPSRNS